MSLMNPLIHQNEKTNTDPDSFKTTYGMNPQRCQYVILTDKNALGKRKCYKMNDNSKRYCSSCTHVFDNVTEHNLNHLGG